MTTRVSSLLLLGAALCGCGEREQWLVSLDTDARVPQFGDRVQIDILDDQGRLACAQCQHTVEAGDALRWPLSFGVSPELAQSASALHVRARLYRADHADVAAQDPIRDGAYLDALGRLPAVPGPVRLSLRMDCFRVGTDRTPSTFRSCDAATGLLVVERDLSTPRADANLLQPGQWPVGQDRPCVGQVPDGMSCIPGGAFLMGALQYRGTPNETYIWAAAPERLVVLSPFALDQREFTVADIVRLRGQMAGVPTPLLRGAGADKDQLCHMQGTAADATNQLPLNCITHDQAATLCGLLNKRLPTEAEWEFAAGNRTQETPYPWGMDAAVCEHAVVGVSIWPTDDGADSTPNGNIDCRAAAAGQLRPFGAQPEGNPLDVTALGVHNLGGNVSEWCADDLWWYIDDCPGRHPQRTWLVDPLCQKNDPRVLAVFRGGQWRAEPLYARSSERNATHALGVLYQDPQDPNEPYANAFGVGFRCAKSLAP